MGQFCRFGNILHHAKEVRLGQQNGGNRIVRGQARFQSGQVGSAVLIGNFLNFYAVKTAIGLEGIAILRMDSPADQHVLTPGGVAGRDSGLCQGAGPIVHGGIGHIHSG